MITIPLWTFILLVLYSCIMVAWNTHVLAKALTKLKFSDCSSFLSLITHKQNNGINNKSHKDSEKI
jgi:hypothetical protein